MQEIVSAQCTLRAGTCDRDGDRGNNERCSGRADSFDGLNLNMIDTAGIRQTEDVVEKIGVEKAREYAESADLIIYVAVLRENWMKMTVRSYRSSQEKK